MSKLAHSDDYHMALIDAQSMIDAGFSKEEIKDNLSYVGLTANQLWDAAGIIDDMKPQLQGA